MLITKGMDTDILDPIVPSCFDISSGITESTSEFVSYCLAPTKVTGDLRFDNECDFDYDFLVRQNSFQDFTRKKCRVTSSDRPPDHYENC